MRQVITNTEELTRLSESANRIEKIRVDPDADEVLLKTDEDCKLAGIKDAKLKTDIFMSEYPLELIYSYSYHSQLEIHAHAQWEMDESPKEVPDCKKHFSLDFSPYAFEHLESMQDRQHLSITPASHWFEEVITQFWMKGQHYNNLRSDVIPIRQIIGPLLRQQMIHKNKAVREMVLLHTSAVSFWIMEGDAPRAMECARTLLHYAQLHHLRHDDSVHWLPLALLQFGNLLTLSARYDDAITVLELGRHSSKEPDQLVLLNAALGDAYALATNFSRAISHYADALKAHDKVQELQASAASPLLSKAFDAKDIIRKRAALLCNNKIREELEAQYANMMVVIKDSAELEARLEGEAAETPTVLMARIRTRRVPLRVHAENMLMFDQAVYGANPNRDCKIVVEAKRASMRCSVQNPRQYERAMSPLRAKTGEGRPTHYNSTSLRLVELFIRDRAHAKKLAEYKNMGMDEGQIQAKYPLPPSLMSKSDPYWRRADWPSAGECNAILVHTDLSDATTIPHVFLSPEEKGYILSDLLTWFIGVEMAEEHPLPWEEPFCLPDSSSESPLAEWSGVKKVMAEKRKEEWAEEELRGVFIRLAETKLQLADVGQRVRTLIEQNIGPRWISFNLAALYWRVQGNPGEAAKCLLSVLHSEDSHRDVSLVQLSQLLLRVGGAAGEAARLLSLAAAAAPHQPQPHFLLARVALLSASVDSAVSHLKDALDRDPFDSQISDDLLSVVCSGQSSKPVVRHLHPTICCSAKVQNAVCFKGIQGERCFVLEGGDDSELQFVYNRCNGQYTGMSYKPYALTYLFAPFLPIFDTVPKKENAFLYDDPAGVQTIQTAELPLDYGGADAFLAPRPTEWFRHARQAIVFESAREREKDDFEIDVAYQQPLIPHKPLSLLWMSHKSEMLKYDVSLPDVLPRPHPQQIRAGLAKFHLPRVTTAMCGGVPKLESLLEFGSSTWVSPNAKGANIDKYLDISSPLPKAGHRLEPECPSPNTAQLSSLLTLDHLPFFPLSDQFLFYKPETALTEALLGKEAKESVEGMGARLAAALRFSGMRGQPAELWVPAVTASLYWRVRGEGGKAVACLRLALTTAPPTMYDIVLVSLASICHQAGLLHSALITAGSALHSSPNLQALHFTLANIYASIGNHERALEFYYSTLSLQSNFEPAKERIRAIYCYNGGENYNIHLRV